ncbi:26S proteasome non-ATPase regulatory subunit 9 [Aureobasidium namibiae CBS 147.97]|uniref:Probable 26S proteasome regulatory subunit p27 n=1 Tax=Aureobasidium namibiae CBS 147.97 TaxID=1043004 RepID=A0A074X1J8_9PEZI|nr:26S proteasome non-ATPase regulatory subunit 9 [Aureobasidium namibiae CBS 147.97]KEQ75922.1 26S proteasome non-ATPase regulatory subunit 9 [Aureobasidium namibiae CBS 147.97]
MNDIHAPTVASGPSSTQANGAEREKLSLPELIAEKDRVWSELSALGSVLDSHGVNMSTPLTTFDGYPRPDLDIAQIRTTRARIIPLKNDYKDLMARIEKAMHAHWENAAAAPLPPPSAVAARPSAQTTEAAARSSRVALEAPFAKVNSVVASSPAARAGLKPGDKITRFGDVDWMNHDKLSKVAQTVQQSEGVGITVKVIRPAATGAGEQRLEMQLTPRHNWGGRGMLGCHLLPL